jgi:hypothetical protein
MALSLSAAIDSNKHVHFAEYMYDSESACSSPDVVHHRKKSKSAGGSAPRASDADRARLLVSLTTDDLRSSLTTESDPVTFSRDGVDVTVPRAKVQLLLLLDLVEGEVDVPLPTLATSLSLSLSDLHPFLVRALGLSLIRGSIDAASDRLLIDDAEVRDVREEDEGPLLTSLSTWSSATAASTSSLSLSLSLSESDAQRSAEVRRRAAGDRAAALSASLSHSPSLSLSSPSAGPPQSKVRRSVW